MHSFLKRPLAALIAATMLCGYAPAADEAEPSTAAELVQLLDHQAYPTRIRAWRTLEKRGPTEDVRAALRQGLKSKSLEIHTASLRLLQHFEFQAFDRELGRLTSPYVAASDVQLAGWDRFSSMAGDDHWSRRLYANIARQHYSLIRKLTRGAVREAAAKNKFVAGSDPYRLPSRDAVSWAMLLFCDSLQTDLGRPDLSPRILNALSHSGLGPTRVSAGDLLVIQRLVGHWMVLHGEVGTVRDRLLVAMRYECRSQAGELCRRTFADRSATASALATAMLCGTVLGHEDLRESLIKGLDDDRTAHVWQLIASRKTKIRTQVRDVALALLLHAQGIDPRTIGFVELQADPLLLYRDHSLGFADQQARETAHAIGRKQLGL